MTSMFQFGSRQGTSVDATSSARQSTATSGGVTSTYSTRDIGAMLRERREAMGVTLAEAEAATRIRQKYVAALESDEWHLLPGEVVGRGFLRNYAAYLGLEPTDVIERRRSVTDDKLSSALVNTSAGSSLPPVRQVDYRPKEVELLDEAEGMETREVRLGPIFAVIGVLALLALLWWGRDSVTDMTTAAIDSMQTLTARPTPAPAIPTAAVAGIVNPENAGQASDGGNGPSDDGGDGTANVEQAPDQAVSAVILVPTATATSEPATPTPQPVVQAAEPTPTETPVPLPTPTDTPVLAAAAPQEAVPDTPILLPTEAPELVEEEAVFAAPICLDQRSLITSPGVNQAVSGVVGVTGTAAHEAFQYYKLEYAPGVDAGGGFVYFDGGNTPVNDGLLGGLDTEILPNGAYTIQLIVVDATGNFPPPCTVTIDVQN